MNKVSVVALIVAISISLPVCFAQRSIKSRADDFINRSHSRIPPMLRLVFHTCLGECNGCINFKDSSNRGLETIYRDARSYCRTQISRLSLADCIVALAISAAEIGMRNGGIRASIPFKEGRITCDDPDNYEEEKTFPKGDDPNAIGILISAFGLTKEEAIALMGGAHSLGSAKSTNSGFQGPWDNSPTALNNGFFLNLVQNTWIFGRIRSTRKPQWNARSGHMMLISDMALLRDVTYGANMQPSCSAVASCPFSNDANLVRTFARDITRWRTVFIEAFGKMINVPERGS